MGRPKIQIKKSELERLYLSQRLSLTKIALKYGCTSVTIGNRLKEAGIPRKTKSQAQIRFNRKDFSGSDTEKSYMLGFRYGDLNVYKPRPTSETIVVRLHTTHTAQEKVFQLLFRRYGKISVARNARSVQLNSYMNLSFSFLLDKYPLKMRKWIRASPERLWAFAAGYIDAEGTFGLNQEKARFKVDAYDKEILHDLHKLFILHGIRSKLRVIAMKGNNDYGWIWKKDVWRLSVNEAGSIERLVVLLKPYLLHAKRVADARKALQNIEIRRKNGTIA